MSEKAVECSVEFPGPASPGFTLSPLRRGGGDPCYMTRGRRCHLANQPDAHRTGDGAHQPVGPTRHRLRGMGKRRNGIRRWVPRAAGRRRRRERVRARGTDDRRGSSAGAASAAGAHRPGAGVPDPGRHRTAGGGQGRFPGVAAAGHQVRITRARARAGADARPAGRPMCGAASRRGSSTSPTSTPAGRARIVGCAQRADSLERLVTRPAERRPSGADLAARRRDMDGGRDRTARVRRRRRAFGRRLPPGEGGRLDPARPSHRRRRDGRVARIRCVRTGTGRCASSRSAAWPATRGSGPARPSRTCARSDAGD